jgi:outer membrane protein assembly factor BamB
MAVRERTPVMPLRPLAIALVVICLVVAVSFIVLTVVLVRRVRGPRWIVVFLLLPALACGWLASLPVPYLLGLNTPHPVFNGPAPVPTGAVAYYLSNLSPLAGQPSSLIAVQASTGKQVWQHELPSPGIRVSADADAVYVLSSNISSTEVFALAGATGALLWQRTLSGATVVSDPLLVGGTLILNLNTLASPTPQQILALRPADGQQLWSAQVGLYDASAVGPLQLIPSPDGKVLYDVPNVSTIEARGIGDGRLLWVNTNIQTSGQVVVGPDAVYVLPQFGSLTAFAVSALANQTGTPLWQFGDHDFFNGGTVSGDTLYLTAQHNGTARDDSGRLTNPETVYALDAHTGVLRWKFATQSANSGYLAAGPAGVFIQADDGIHALRPANGAVLWHSSAQNNWIFPRTSLFIGSVIFFEAVQTLPPETLSLLGQSKGQAYLYAVNAAQGDLYWSAPVGPVITISPHIVL